MYAQDLFNVQLFEIILFNRGGASQGRGFLNEAGWYYLALFNRKEASTIPSMAALIWPVLTENASRNNSPLDRLFFLAPSDWYD
ncbi:MAG: hypothetical protein M1330_00065 [Armatimonadetes bacterium]|nr:hypothetical protein [Armatimonadota bacterium]